MCPGNTHAWSSVTSQGMPCVAPGWQVILLRPLCLPQAQRMEGDAPAGFTPGEKISYLPQMTLGTFTVYSSFIFKQWHWKCHYLYLLVPEPSHWVSWESRGTSNRFFILWEQAHKNCIRCYKNVIWLFQLMKTGRNFFLSILSHFSHSQWAVKGNEVICLNLHAWKFIDNHTEF